MKELVLGTKKACFREILEGKQRKSSREFPGSFLGNFVGKVVKLAFAVYELLFRGVLQRMGTFLQKNPTNLEEGITKNTKHLNILFKSFFRGGHSARGKLSIRGKLSYRGGHSVRE